MDAPRLMGHPVSAVTVVVTGLVWLAIATALGAAGAVQALPPRAVPLVLFGLTIVLLVLAWRHRGVRAWLAVIDMRWLVALHVTRFVGIYFLVLYARGELPYAFAVPGGWGDIAVATLATLLLVAVRPRDGWPRRAYAAWNVLGLADILFVVATAGRLVAAEPASMAALQRLPLSLLPTFLVPLIIASHAVLLWRLRRCGAPGGATIAPP